MNEIAVESDFDIVEDVCIEDLTQAGAMAGATALCYGSGATFSCPFGSASSYGSLSSH